MKVICYSLFGHERARQDNCFDFYSYLRGLMINIRMNRLIFPDWKVNLQTDQATYDAWKGLLDKIGIEIEVHKNDVPLTLAMLWRLRPIFEFKEGFSKYSHVLCRDLDSPPTFREAQAVKHWMNKETACHAITDSVSHNIAMMGGMIGFIPKYFYDRVKARTWKELIDKRNSYDWKRKGSDQSFLNDVIYPAFARQGHDSITQHYFKGMPNTFLGHYHTCPCDSIAGHDSRCHNNTELDIPFEYSESNSVCGHIGAAGYYPSVLFKFLRKHKDKFEDLLEVEKQWPVVFHWTQDGTFE